MAVTVVPAFVESGGEQIYFEVIGEADEPERPVVVLTHGAGSNHAVWFQQVPALVDRYRVITWDSRGFGNSTNHRHDISVATAAGDLAAVLDAAGVESAHLVAQSMGGWWAVAFAVGVGADRTRSLTLSGTIGGLYTPELDEEMRRATADRRGFGGPGLLGHHRAIADVTTARDPALGFLYQQLGSLHDPPMAEIGPAVVEGRFAHDDVSALGIPVLGIAGVHDGLFPIAMLRRSLERIDGARFVEIPDAGHSPYFEQPEAFNRELRRFLDGLRRGGDTVRP